MLRDNFQFYLFPYFCQTVIGDQTKKSEQKYRKYWDFKQVPDETYSSGIKLVLKS